MDQLPELPTAQAAIFDLDGTLLDTLGDLADAVNGALDVCGFPRHPEGAIRGFIGDGAEVLIRRSMPEAVCEDAEEVSRCLASFHRIYGENFANRTCAYPGIADLLVELRALGVPLGVLSNKPHAFTLRCSETYFGKVGEQFQVVFGQREGVPKKPDPAGAIEAAGQLGVAPDDCAYVGDSGVDMRTARAAGMIPVGVTWGFRDRQELIDEGAAALIDSPAELVEVFRGVKMLKNQRENA